MAAPLVTESLPERFYSIGVWPWSARARRIVVDVAPEHAALIPWCPLERSAYDAAPDVILLLCEDGREHETADALRGAHSGGLMGRIVVAAPLTPNWANLLIREGASHAVWWESQPLDALRDIVHRALLEQAAPTLLRAFMARTRNHLALARVVQVAFRPDRPVLSVAEMAACANTNGRQLRRMWCDCLPESPRALADWATLARGIDQLTRGRPVSSVAFSLGVDESTMYRVAQRRVGRSLTSLTPQGVSRAGVSWSLRRS